MSGDNSLPDPSTLTRPVRRAIWASISLLACSTFSGMPVTSKMGSFSLDGVTMYVLVCCWIRLIVAPLGPTTKPTTRYGTRTFFIKTTFIKHFAKQQAMKASVVYLDGDLTGDGWRRNESSSTGNAALADQSRSSRCSYLWKVLSGWKDFAFGSCDIFFASGNDENGFFSTDGRLDVRVCFSPECLDFAPCKINKEKRWMKRVNKEWLDKSTRLLCVRVPSQHRHGLNRTLQTTHNTVEVCVWV